MKISAISMTSIDRSLTKLFPIATSRRDIRKEKNIDTNASVKIF